MQLLENKRRRLALIDTNHAFFFALNKPLSLSPGAREPTRLSLAASHQGLFTANKTRTGTSEFCFG